MKGLQAVGRRCEENAEISIDVMGVVMSPKRFKTSKEPRAAFLAPKPQEGFGDRPRLYARREPTKTGTIAS